MLDQSRLQLMGLSSEDVAQQLQFLLLGVPVTQIRNDIRTVEIVARSAGATRLDPAKLGQFTLTTATGKPVPLSQIGRITIDEEYPYMIRRDRIPTITVQSDIDAISQPPQVSAAVPVLLIFHQPFGFNAILGLIALSGI